MAIRLTIAAFSIAGTWAQMQDDAICASVCGLLADSTKDCRLTTAVNGVCERLFYDNTNTLVYEAGIMDGQRALPVSEALPLVRAKDDNCYAMCYNDKACREVGSHCSENGVCKNLFWNQYDNRETSSYKLLTEHNAQYVNQDSPIMCDPVSGKEPEILDYPGVIDMCQAVCSLTHTADECSRVYRVGYDCYRLFWADASKTATVFTVDRINNGELQIVTVQEAFDLLMAKDNSCENLCRRHPTCKLAPEMAHCNEVNRSCRGLFYYSGTIEKSGMQVCFGTSCKEYSPVTCRLPNDAANFLVKPVMKAMVDAQAEVTDATKSYEMACAASIVVAPLLIALLME